MLRTVTIETGTVEGLPAADPRITVFKGIPFAAPPVGDLRWKAPQPAANWEGVFKAWQFGPIAMQPTPGVHPEEFYSKEWHVDPDIPMSEDCLQLNVWTPARTVEEKLPVMVWIFGGGLQVGYPSEMEFDGERFARRGVILVSLNYRLNAFGFLAHPELTAEDPEHATNFGHWDQRFGIAWVRRNIAAFGGDPENITVFGQSAGAGSTIVQLASPLNAGLFQRAIVHSGGGLIPPGVNSPTLAEAEQNGMDFFAHMGVKTLAEARRLDALTIREKFESFGGPPMRFGTVVDGTLVPDLPPYRIAGGQRNPVDLIIGHTAAEFPIRPSATTEAELEALARERFGERADDYLSLCREDAETLDDMMKNGTWNRFEVGDLMWGDINDEMGAPRMFMYLFDPSIPGPDCPGSFHSSDLWFAFETLAKCWRPFVGKHYDLARRMCNYWTNFAKTGDPNGPDADGTPMPQWTPYTAEVPLRMRLCDVTEMETAPRSAMNRLLVSFYREKLDGRDLRGSFSTTPGR